MDKNCVIIKKRELDGLYEELENTKTHYEEEIKALKKELQNEKDAKKPDEITVNLVISKETSNPRYRYMTIYYGTLSSSLDLSIGIRLQIRSILSKVIDALDKIYLEKFKDSEKSIKNEVNNSRINDISILKNSLRPYYIKKSVVINKLNDIIESWKKELQEKT